MSGGRMHTQLQDEK